MRRNEEEESDDELRKLSKSPSLRFAMPGPDRYDTRSAFTKVMAKPEIKFPKAERVTLGHQGSNGDLPGPGQYLSKRMFDNKQIIKYRDFDAPSPAVNRLNTSRVSLVSERAKSSAVITNHPSANSIMTYREHPYKYSKDVNTERRTQANDKLKRMQVQALQKGFNYDPQSLSSRQGNSL